MNLHHAMETYSFFRRPDWRWERVLVLAGHKPTPRRPGRSDDKYVRDGRNFILKYNAPDQEDHLDELFARNIDMFYAYKIHEKELEESDTAMMIQARILAGQSNDQIHNATGILPNTIEYYEQLFFNVRDRLKYRDYITKNVLIPAMQRNFGLVPSHHDADNPVMPWSKEIIARPFLDASIKMFAYFAGPIVLEFMLQSFQTGKICNSQDEMAKYLDDHWATTLRARSSQAVRTFEINKFNVIELFGIHARLMEIEKSEETLDQKKNQIEQSIGGLMSEIENVYSIGDETNEFLSPKVKVYDKMAAELRDGEVGALAAGLNVKGLDDLESLRLPSPVRALPTDTK